MSIKKTIYALFAIFMAFTMGFAQAAAGTDINHAVQHLQDDGKLIIPNVRVGNDHYTVVFQLFSPQFGSAGALFTPSFKLLSITSVAVTGNEAANEHSFYDTIGGQLNLPLVYIDESPYALTLTLQKNTSSSTDLIFKVTKINPADELSMLFLISGTNASLLPKGTYGDKAVGLHFVVDAESHFVAFSDRPNRVATHMEGGLTGFVDVYNSSNFLENPPNVTFGAKNILTGKYEATVFEMIDPFVYDGKFIMPVVGAIGVEKMPPLGEYSSANFVIDSWPFFSDVADAVTTGVNEVARIVDNTVDNIGDVSREIVSSTVDVISFGVSKIGELSSEIVDVFEKEVNNAKMVLGNALVEGYNDVVSAVQGEVDEFAGNTEALITALKNDGPTLKRLLLIDGLFSDNPLKMFNPGYINNVLSNTQQTRTALAELGAHTLMVGVKVESSDIVGSGSVIGLLIDVDTLDIGIYQTAELSAGAQAGADVSVIFGYAVGNIDSVGGLGVGVGASATLGLGMAVGADWNASIGFPSERLDDNVKQIALRSLGGLAGIMSAFVNLEFSGLSLGIGAGGELSLAGSVGYTKIIGTINVSDLLTDAENNDLQAILNDFIELLGYAGLNSQDLSSKLNQ